MELAPRVGDTALSPTRAADTSPVLGFVLHRRAVGLAVLDVVVFDSHQL